MAPIRGDLRHPWRVTLPQAAAIQMRLAGEVVLRPLPAIGPGAPR
jgi:hypothetical protein